MIRHLHPPGDFVSDFIRENGVPYEDAILRELRRWVYGGAMVDVGAHIGNHTEFFATELAAETVWAFEPHPANFELLRMNTEHLPNVMLQPYAVSDERHAVSLIEEDNLGHVRVSLAGGGTSVMAYPLDAFGIQKVSLLKVDVEGYEPYVLLGAKETIAANRPLILIEDWEERYGPLLPGYKMVREWRTAHQTYLYQWAG